MTDVPVKNLNVGDLIISHGCTCRVLELPRINTTSDPFGREMYVFRAEIVTGTEQGRHTGDSGELVYGLTAEVTMGNTPDTTEVTKW